MGMRIIYMGTPDFAVAGLRALVEAGKEVVAVVTGMDKPVGRGHHLQPTPVKQYAVEHGIDVLQPESLKDEAFIAQLATYHADLQIVIAFRMLPESVWAMPRLGTFNVHGSLLPQYRGAAPIQWAVMNGETQTGLTTFLLDHQMDTGAIIEQVKTAIGPDETVGEVYDRLMEMSGPMVLSTLAKIEEANARGEHVATIAQPHSNTLKPAPKIWRETMEIDWSRTTAEIHNHVRGLNPYPAARTTLEIGGQTYEDVKVFRISRGTGLIPHPTADGVVSIDELQIPGKRRMSARDVLNGLR